MNPQLRGGAWADPRLSCPHTALLTEVKLALFGFAVVFSLRQHQESFCLIPAEASADFLALSLYTFKNCCQLRCPQKTGFLMRMHPEVGLGHPLLLEMAPAQTIGRQGKGCCP